MVRARRILHALGLVCTLLIGAEAAARLDDWVRQDVPPTADPDRDRDLLVAEAWGFRGRPHGRFRKWQLDALGFRRTPGGTEGPCVLLLGASETFGLYESPEKEYPAQLARLLQCKQPCRVLNASIPGISLSTLTAYWDNWARRTGAGQVVIYPSPHFYLDDEPPHPPAGRAAAEVPLPRPRLVQRAKDVYQRLPAWLKAYREEWVIRRETAGKGEDWVFRRVPEDRLRLFADDLARLTDHVRQSGAEPVLVTHAISASSPPAPQDESRLRGMRMFTPRATPETLVAFDKRANDVVRELAGREHLVLIDADRALSGRRELFADLVHFNDDGAARMAELLAEHLPPLHTPHTLTRRP